MVAVGRGFERWYLFFVAACSLWYLLVSRSTAGSWFFLVLAVLLAAILALALPGKPGSKRFRSPFKVPESLAWLLSTLLVSIPSILTFVYPAEIAFHESGRLILLLLACGVSVLLLPKQDSGQVFLLLLLVGGVLFRLAAFVPELQSAPFSLGWSEGSRYVNASLFFSEAIYGEKLPLPVLHPTRYLLLSLPFLGQGAVSILVHRLWQVVLWISLTALGSYYLAKRLRWPNKIFAWMLGLWFFLFFFQGAVYYHLMVCVIIVLAGYDPRQPRRTLLAVVIASVWAGLSRVNWYPVPALLAVALYVMETPIGKNSWRQYLAQPFIWCVAGAASALSASWLYARLSGNVVEQFASSFTSYMVWSRLLPNTTYPPGIILGLAAILFPTAALIFMRLTAGAWRKDYQPFRLLILLAILTMFALGGVIVSVKVGGGGDLHNLDAFLVFWLVISAYILFDSYRLERKQAKRTSVLNFGLLALALVIPILLVFQNDPAWRFRDVAVQRRDVAHLQQAVDIVNLASGKQAVLFITEAQLLAFGEIHNVRAAPEYEKLFLMEMVMSNNRAFLDEFHRKLQEQQFSAILLDSVNTFILDADDAFWVENNLWVQRVLVPIMEYYEPALSFQGGAVNLLVPRNQLPLYDELKRSQP